jgi:hypothetical protein
MVQPQSRRRPQRWSWFALTTLLAATQLPATAGNLSSKSRENAFIGYSETGRSVGHKCVDHEMECASYAQVRARPSPPRETLSRGRVLVVQRGTRACTRATHATERGGGARAQDGLCRSPAVKRNCMRSCNLCPTTPAEKQERKATQGLVGCATPDATRDFARQRKRYAHGHFRQIHSLTLSTLGIGGSPAPVPSVLYSPLCDPPHPPGLLSSLGCESARRKP